MRKAVILTLEEDTQEIKSLLQNLNIEVMKEFHQKNVHSHKASFLGPGKIDEVYEKIKDLDVDLIVVNDVLRPSQHHFLEMKFQVECIDRPGVILRIFADHAHTPEAIAQVTLARLRYEVPFLREWIHKAKSGDRPGFLGGGAYATDVYYEHAKTHARRIEERLKELSRQREITRTERKSKGYALVSLAGYTNAGKSALMNKVCKSNVNVDSRLFSTLSTTTRRVPGIKGNVLMTDTVGFIKDLPPELIKAFHSTLEEIYYADLILLVFDASERCEDVKMKVETSMKILLPRIEGRSLLVVGNKIDLLSEKDCGYVSALVGPLVSPFELRLVSSVSGEGIEGLKERIETMQNRSHSIVAHLPLTNESYSLASRLRAIADVRSTPHQDSLVVQIRCRSADSQKIIGWMEAVGAYDMVVEEQPPQGIFESKTNSSGKEGAPL